MSDHCIDPWGGRCEHQSIYFEFCDFVGPNGLPCTSNRNHHPAMHYTSDGRCWALNEYDEETP